MAASLIVGVTTCVAMTALGVHVFRRRRWPSDRILGAVLLVLAASMVVDMLLGTWVMPILGGASVVALIAATVTRSRILRREKVPEGREGRIFK